jgi:hypothetical protein
MSDDDFQRGWLAATTAAAGAVANLSPAEGFRAAVDVEAMGEALKGERGGVLDGLLLDAHVEVDRLKALVGLWRGRAKTLEAKVAALELQQRRHP